jgi:hypothetical protein
MKKVLFVISHEYSGSDYLVRILNNNPRCVIFTSKNQYDHPDSLNWLYEHHKLSNFSGSVYGDHLLYNYLFSCKYLYSCCRFIYVIRNPKQTLSEINFPNKNFINYYKFRLRRIAEMSRKTKNAIFLSYDQLINASSFNKIEDYLGLIEPLKHLELENQNKENKNNFSKEELDSLEDCYEKYFYYINSLKTLQKL